MKKRSRHSAADRLLPALLPALAAVAVTAAACGSRGPLDDTPYGGGAGPDASTSADASPTPTPIPLPLDGGADGRTGPDLPPIVDCGLCLASECGQPILACVTNPTCQQAFQCVLTTCGAALDPACILGCAKTSPAGALQLLSIFQCVTGKCGPDCGEVLGQLGGGLPGVPGTPGRDAGPPPRPDAGPPPPPGVPFREPGGREALERAFSAWPELLTPSR